MEKLDEIKARLHSVYRDVFNTGQTIDVEIDAGIQKAYDLGVAEGEFRAKQRPLFDGVEPKPIQTEE